MTESRFAGGRDVASSTILGEDFEDLYENAPCGYLSTLPDGTILKANRTFLESTGYRADELVGHRRFVDILTPGCRIYHETHYAPLLQMQQRVRELALDLVRADGSSLPVFINATVRTVGSGAPSLVRIAVTTATDRREYERELLRARRRAEDSEATARALARTLQESLIPPEPPTIPGLDVAAVYRPAGAGDELGGDFYDVFQTGGGGTWAVLVGDVAGKGVEAAKTTALVRYTVHAAALRDPDPAPVLATVNEAILRASGDRLCTAVYASFHAGPDGAWRMTVASAGHPLPFVNDATGPQVVGKPGSLLGLTEDPWVVESTLDLAVGETVLFYTDGLIEGRRESEFYGEAKLESRFAALAYEDASVVARNLVDDVVAFQSGVTRDDIAVVVVKVPRL